MLKTMTHKLSAVLVSILLANAAHAIEVGAEAPAFSLPPLDANVSGRNIDIGSFRGKVVYLDFWASWCAPCQVSIPLLSELRNRYAEQRLDFEVVAINVDSDPADGTDFLLDVPVQYVVLSDPAGVTPALYEVKGMPTSYLIDKTGKVRLVHSGFKRSDIDMIAEELQKLLAEEP
ncbi:MAG: TlpA disulfide reductase family protein [Pseudomonadota bacterium]